MNFLDYKKIRDVYKEKLASGELGIDPYFVTYTMTPIEENVWCHLRCGDMPFYFQFPVLNYFADFAAPSEKIIVECDGKQWHDKEKDQIRDNRLIADGWIVYRISGHECLTVKPIPYEVENKNNCDTKFWFMNTAEGICHAINAYHFKDEHSSFTNNNWTLILQTLNKHRSKSTVRYDMPGI